MSLMSTLQDWDLGMGPHCSQNPDFRNGFLESASNDPKEYVVTSMLINDSLWF